MIQEHLSEELLERYFGGELEESQCEEIERHLGLCFKCSERTYQMAEVSAAYGPLTPEACRDALTRETQAEPRHGELADVSAADSPPVRPEVPQKVSPPSVLDLFLQMLAPVPSLTPATAARAVDMEARREPIPELRDTLARIAASATKDSQLREALADFEKAFADDRVRPDLLKVLAAFSRATGMK